jgi:hypothetical protein
MYYRVVVSASGSGCGAPKESASTEVEVKGIPSVTTTVVNPEVCMGGEAVIKATISGGAGSLTYQWEMSTDQSNWADILNTNTNIYKPMTDAVGVSYYRIKVMASGNGCGSSVSSDITEITVKEGATVEIAANNTSVCIGGDVILTANINGGTGTPNYQWQVSSDNNAWSDILNEKNNTYKVPTTGIGNTYYRVAMSMSGSGCSTPSNSSSIQVTVKDGPSATVSIDGKAVCIGAEVEIKANVSGGTGQISYQWQRSTDNANWTDISGEKSLTLKVATQIEGVSYYRMAITADGNGCGAPSTSTSARVEVAPQPRITNELEDVKQCTGGNSILKVVSVGGTGTATYQWQRSDDNRAWVDISNTNNETYTPSSIGLDTTFYRAIVFYSGENCKESTSNSARVEITGTPSVNLAVNNVTVCIGGAANLNANVEGGAGKISYQWQTSTDKNSWNSIEGANDNNYKAPTSEKGAKHYRVVFTAEGSGCETPLNSAIGTVVVEEPTKISANLEDIKECINGTQSLTVNTTGGVGEFSYQWQKSTDGENAWMDVAGAPNSNTYKPTSDKTGTSFYRVIISSSGVGCGLRISSPAKVEIVPVPSITITTSTPEVCLGNEVLFKAKVIGGAGDCNLQWQTSENSGQTWKDIPGATSDSYTTPPKITSDMRFRARVVCSGNGCCQ